MLVLTRRENERLLIGDNIWITIVRVTPEQVWIGIEAPPDVKVVREELICRTPDDLN